MAALCTAPSIKQVVLLYYRFINMGKISLVTRKPVSYKTDGLSSQGFYEAETTLLNFSANHWILSSYSAQWLERGARNQKVQDLRPATAMSSLGDHN
jgi:hypothetical protein